MSALVLQVLVIQACDTKLAFSMCQLHVAPSLKERESIRAENESGLFLPVKSNFLFSKATPSAIHSNVRCQAMTVPSRRRPISPVGNVITCNSFAGTVLQAFQLSPCTRDRVIECVHCHPHTTSSPRPPHRHFVTLHTQATFVVPTPVVPAHIVTLQDVLK